MKTPQTRKIPPPDDGPTPDKPGMHTPPGRPGRQGGSSRLCLVAALPWGCLSLLPAPQAQAADSAFALHLLSADDWLAWWHCLPLMWALLLIAALGGWGLYRCRKTAAQRHAEKALRDRNLVLEDLLHCTVFPDLLNQVVTRMEKEKPGVLVSIVIMDALHGMPTHRVASSDPSGLLSHFEPEREMSRFRACAQGAVSRSGTGPVSPCMQALSENRRVFIRQQTSTGIAEDFLREARPFDTSACWSEPIRANDGSLLGALTLYYRGASRPETGDQNLISTYTCLLALATLHHRLENEADLLRSLIEFSGDIVYLVAPDEDFRLCYVNQAAVRFFGYPKEQVLRMRIQDYDPHATPERLHTIWQTLKQRQSFVVESVNNTARGQNMPVQIACHYFCHQGREYIAGHFRELAPDKEPDSNTPDA